MLGLNSTFNLENLAHSTEGDILNNLVVMSEQEDILHVLQDDVITLYLSMERRFME